VAMSPRSEPLLWIQLLGVGVLPLELLLLLLVLAGSDPGPVPALERLLCWGLGGLGSTLLLWHRPADVWSLLLLQTPLRARRPLQQSLSRLQQDLLPRLMLAPGGLAGLPLLWWLDDHAAMAAPFSPVAGSPRLVALLLASLLLALMVWQWQQLVQALWLLSRPAAAVVASRPMSLEDLEQQRLCLGLPLLLPEPLVLGPGPSPAAGGTPGGSPAAMPSVPGISGDDGPPEGDSEPAPTRTDATQDVATGMVPSAGLRTAPPRQELAPGPGTSTAAVPAAVDPEQTAEQQQGDDLDQQIL
jgi:hypothetical protein